MENFEKIKTSINIEGRDFQFDSEGFVRFGDVALHLLDEQSQYASRYIDGKIEGYPDLGDGLKFNGKSRDYHTIRIHKDDIEEFVKRFQEHRNE